MSIKTAQTKSPKPAAKSADFLRLLFERHPLPMWVYDLKTLAFLDVNEAALEKYGYSRTEFLKMTLKDIRPQEDVERLTSDVKKKRSALQHSGEWRHRLKDGHIIDVEINSHEVAFEGHSAALVIAQDITDRKRAEEALRESEANLNHAQAIAHIGSWSMDVANNILVWSAETHRIFGIAAETPITYEIFLSHVHPDDRDFVNRSWQAALHGAPYNIEHRIIVDGQIKWVRERVRLETNSDGNPLRGTGIVQDITEHKLHERELEAEAMLAQALSETLQLQPLLERLLEAARHAIPAAEKGSLALMFDDEHLQVRAISGYRESRTLGYTYPITWGYAGRVARRRHPLLISDIQVDSELHGDAANAAVGEVRDLRSAIAVPLLTQETIIGVLSLESTRAGVFKEEDLRLLVNFAISASLIIERARLFEETRRRAEETTALLSTSLALNNLDLQTTLQTIGDHSKALFAADGCRIFLLESDEKTLRCVLALLENSDAFSDLKIRIGEGVTGSVAASGEAEIVNDMAHDLRSVQVPGTPEEDESIMFAPLKSGERVIGVMSIKRVGSERPFSPSDLELLKAFASLSASAVSNARLFDETRQHVAELEMIYESGLALGQLLSPKEIGEKIIALLEQKMGWHHTIIRLYHPQNDSFELLAFNQPGLKDEAELKATGERFNALISKAGVGLSGWVVKNSQIVRSGDVSHDPRYVDTYPGLRSGLYVPMKLGGYTIGVVSIESEQPNAFSEADERLVATLANQASIALENARLFEETRQRVTELETVNRISIALRAISKQEEMLAVVLEETLTALKATHGSINLLNEATGKLHRSIARGWPSEFSESPIPPGEGIFGTVFASGDAHITRDLANDPLTRPEVRGQLPPGWGGVCVPIRSAEKTLGVMLISVSAERELGKDEVRLVNTLADMTGNALYRMKLHDEAVHRAEEFVSLYEMNTAITLEHDLRTLVQTIVGSAVTLLNATAGGMYLHDPVSGELEVVVATHPSVRVGTRLQLGEGGAGRVAESRQPLRINDYSAWEGRSEKYHNTQIRAILEVPILFGGELIGVLVAHEVGSVERKFTDGDERLLSLFATQAAGVIRSARLREETQHRLENLQALREVDRVITSSFDLHPILSTVINHTIIQLGVDAADVLLFNPILQTLEYAAGYGFYTRGIEHTNSRLGEGHAGSAALTHRTVHVPNLPETGSKFMRASLLAGENFLEYYGVPLISKGEVKGVLEVFHRSPLSPKPEWLELLETLAGQTAIAIDNAHLFENIQRSNMELGLAYEATIEGWSRAMELRDEETEGHTQRVTEKTIALALALGVRDDNLLHIRRGALLHDIGKIGVPDDILLKSGPLTDGEWEVMRKHPQFAFDMLHPIAYLRQSLDIPYLHHEKWDGTGYPKRLEGEQVPLAARIFAIVDVYDALTSDRPYRKAWAKADAINYIRQQSGKHFDPQVVEKFLQLFGNDRD